jgi:glycosyltransferase involved in cell wall biosynthesis
VRILKTTQSYYPYLSQGGPPLKVRALARALAREGHQVTVLTACLPDEEAGAALDAPTSMSRSGSWIAKDRGVEAIYLPSVLHYRATTINPRVLNFCRRRLAEFDLVHIYGLYDLIGPVVAWQCRRRGLPYVVEPLGMFGPKVRSQHKKRVYQKLVGGALLRGAAAIIATSEHERAELIAGGLPAAKIQLRRNGIDLSEFAALPRRGAFRRSLGVNETEPLALFLGRLSFIKGLDVLVQAFAQADLPARLIIAGPDDGDGCRAAVENLLRKLQLHERVSLLSPIYEQQKLEALVDADLFVLPSVYESFGNAAAEAIACGTPVLVTEGCGIAPLIDGRAGLVTACSLEALAQGLERLLKTDALRLSLQAGCAAVAANLSWDEPVALLEKLYQTIANTSAPVGSAAVA